jgi:hypothetical protein
MLTPLNKTKPFANPSLRHICKAHKPNTQKPTLQKSLNARLLPAAVFQSNYRAKLQHTIITSIIVIFICITSIAQPKVPIPNFNNFQIVTTQNTQPKQQTTYNTFSDPITGTNMPLGMTAADVINQVQQNAMRQMGTLPAPISNHQNQKAQLAELNREEAQETYYRTLNHFQTYYKQLQQLNSSNFSITRAVYLCEAGFYNNPYSYADFTKAIQQQALFVRQILKQENKSIKNGSAVQYAIQQLFSKNTTIQLANKTIRLKKFEYDFEDFEGDKDYTKMFVTKLLQTGKGQCHSMPLLYLCIAEQLKTKAWLSLAPAHSFIKFMDSEGNLSNFEATNGHIVSTTWLLHSNAISAAALKNNTYLDTLSSKQLYAQCLADFSMAYEAKNGYDDFAMKLTDDIIKIDSNNIVALMNRSNYFAYQFKALFKQYNIQSQKQINATPIILHAQQQMLSAQQKINDLGYQDMPKEQYIQWLQSIEIEKAKQQPPTKK